MVEQDGKETGRREILTLLRYMAWVALETNCRLTGDSARKDNDFSANSTGYNPGKGRGAKGRGASSEHGASSLPSTGPVKPTLILQQSKSWPDASHAGEESSPALRTGTRSTVAPREREDRGDDAE